MSIFTKVKVLILENIAMDIAKSFTLGADRT